MYLTKLYCKCIELHLCTCKSILCRMMKTKGETELLDLNLRHAWNQTWYSLAGIIHMAAWFQILGIPHVDSSQRSAWLHITPLHPKTEQLWSLPPYRGACLITPSSVCILIGHTKLRHHTAKGYLFRQWTQTGFQCNVCRGRPWKHHSSVAASRVNREITSQRSREDSLLMTDLGNEISCR